MTSLLKCYFPQVLSWFPDLSTLLVCDFLLRWPALERLRGVKRTSLLNFFREHHRSAEHTSELQSHRDLPSFPTRRSSDLSAPFWSATFSCAGQLWNDSAA